MLARGVGLAVLAAFLCLSGMARAQDLAASLPGVWRVTSVQTMEVVSGKVVLPFGERPTGSFIFTPGGRMIGMQYGTDRQPPAGTNATDAEKAALFGSMSAYAGTWRADGKRLLIGIEDSSIQSWNGTQRVINIELDGKKLTGKSNPFKSLMSGLDVVAVITWEKIE